MAVLSPFLFLFALGSVSIDPRPSGFSWNTLPVHWFSSNSTSQLSAAAAERIASRHSLVIINGQSHAYHADPGGRGSENKMIIAGKVIKEAAGRLGIPNPSVLAYFNSIVVGSELAIVVGIEQDCCCQYVNSIERVYCFQGYFPAHPPLTTLFLTVFSSCTCKIGLDSL